MTRAPAGQPAAAQGSEKGEDMSGPLAGIKVVEMGVWVAAPATGWVHDNGRAKRRC